MDEAYPSSLCRFFCGRNMTRTRKTKKCVICGQSKRRKLMWENDSEVYCFWRNDCADTLCEILFGGTEPGQSLVSCFQELCNSCEQLARDAHFTYSRLKAFENTLKNLTTLLRRKIRTNYWKINNERIEKGDMDTPSLDNFNPHVKYSRRHLNHIFYTLMSRCNNISEDTAEREARKPLGTSEINGIQVKLEPMEPDYVDVDIWKAQSSSDNDSTNSNPDGDQFDLKFLKAEIKVEPLIPKVKVRRKRESDRKDKKSRKGRKLKREKRKTDAHMKKRTVKCTEENCDLTFLSDGHMTAHVRGFHQGVEKPHECPQCGKCFGRRIMMMHHVRVVHKKRKSPYNHFCKFCRKGYVEESELAAHYAVSHLDPYPFKCAFCSTVICSNSVDLAVHMKKVHPDPEEIKLLSQCTICQKYFSNPQNLAVHFKLHGDPESIPKCEVCQQVFANKGSLRKHTLKKHTTELKLCETCGKGFAYLPDLTEHMKRHDEKKKNYSCKVCDKKFFDSKACRRHEISHTGIKNFICHLCGKAFGYRGNLTAHQKLHTSGVESRTQQKRRRKTKEKEQEICWTDFNPLNLASFT